MFCAHYDVSRELEFTAKIVERRAVMFFVRWCPILLIAFTLVAFVFIEHTKVANLNNNIFLDERAKQFQPYPYDSNEITGARNCFWPILTEDDLILLDAREETAIIDCKPRYARLFSLHESGILIPQVARNDFSGVECMYRSVDDLTSKGAQLSTEGPTFLVGMKRVFVECLRNQSIIYSKEFLNFAAQPNLAKARQREPDSLNLSLTIIALDSVSLTEFHRLMPLSSRYMQYLGFIDSEMFNKKDLNETVEDLLVRGEQPVWELMNDRGCISYWNGRASNGSVDYSGVDFFVDEAAKDENELCSPDGSSIARDNFDLLDRFHNHYAKQCTFSLQTVRGFREEINYGNNSTRWFSRLAALDSQLRSMLERLVSNKIAATTAIVVMGDLGNKQDTDTYAGRVQQSNPLFSIRMPHGFRANRPEETATLYRNRKRLTSNDDIAETLQHIARGFNEKVVIEKVFDAKGRELGNFNATSLFAEKYHDWRWCGHLGIGDATCVCVNSRGGRTKSIGRESPEHIAVRSLIKAQLDDLPCIREVMDVKEGPPLQVHEPRLLPSEINEKSLRDFNEGLEPRGDLEYFRMEFQLVVHEQPFREFWQMRVRGHVRHDVRRDRYQLLGEIAIVGTWGTECTAQRMRDFCQLCTVQGLDVTLKKDSNDLEGDNELLSAMTHL